MVDEKQTDGNPETSPSGAQTGPWVDRKQTGTCEEAQADGVPCDHADGQCEDCEHSALNGAAGS